MPSFTLSTTGDHRINIAPNTIGPDGIAIQFDEVGTISAVLKVNTAPPGAAVSLSSVAYLNSSYAEQSAGTAITADGIIYVPAATAAAGDLYLTLTVTSGYVVVNTFPAQYSPVDETELVGTLATAAQPNITSVGTLTAPVVTRLNIGAAAGAAASDSTIVKAVSGIPDNTATTVLTVTVPNSAQGAVVQLTLVGSQGAGGDIGAYEASAVNSYNIVIARTAGVNAVAEISSAFGADAATVAGGDAVTAAVTLGAVAGAVGAVNTVPVQVTIVKAGGASDNHTALLKASVLNAVASGVTIA